MSRRYRRNLGPPPAKAAGPAKPVAASSPQIIRRSSGGGLRNWLILGGVGFGAYYVYKKFSAKKVADEISKASGKGVADPDLNGPLVTKYGIFSTKTPICITSQVRGFVYAKITSTNPVTGYSTFSAPVAGHFTRRCLCSGGQRIAAEIKPTPGLSGLMALGDLASPVPRRLD